MRRRLHDCLKCLLTDEDDNVDNVFELCVHMMMIYYMFIDFYSHILYAEMISSTFPLALQLTASILLYLLLFYDCDSVLVIGSSAVLL